MIVRLIQLYANNCFYSQNKTSIYKIAINSLLSVLPMLFLCL